MNIKDDKFLSQINSGYLVGGAVRDFLMKNIIPSDKDITVKNAEAFAKDISLKFDGTVVVLDEENKIYRVVLQD